MVEYLCLITTPSYAPGAVCLAQSLLLVGSAATLRVIATTLETVSALELVMSQCPIPQPKLVIDYRPIPLPVASEGEPTHGAKGASLSVDAPRRALFTLGAKPFVLLDADLIAVRNPDLFLQIVPGQESISCSANFRVKKQCFGPITGNFNAGVMVVSSPRGEDGDTLAQLVQNAGEDDTEELLLNKIFKSRWKELPNGLNVPKRVLYHAPERWNQLVASKEMVFVHYMGAKPWINDPIKRVGADWEADRPEYLALEQVWWKIHRGEIALGEDVTVHLPLGNV
ncbi:hypothetical protein BASA81_005767 [Batrachochytrium salamandrivorans]|nr:hypothetical protein BASA81_005767 [Batrachochytrium salamandrivorans]